jgi:hypothetical protein
MFFEPFFSKFPEIAKNETRCITVFDDSSSLPRGEYGLIELFCTEKGCDCRRVMIQVMWSAEESRPPLHLASISYGWEPDNFYRKWSPGMPDEELAWFKGPALDPFQKQSQFADELLKLFKEVLKDDAYRERIVRHYELFKKQPTGLKRRKTKRRWGTK